MIGCCPSNFYETGVSFAEYILYQFIFSQLFYDGGPYHVETSPMIWRTNQWTGFYVIGMSFKIELISVFAMFFLPVDSAVNSSIWSCCP